MLLFLLRSQLVSLAQRLSELTLPGGAKASFKDLIQGAKNSAEAIVSDDAQKKPDENSSQKPPTPKQRIVRKFEEMEAAIATMISGLPIQQRKIPADFIFYTLWQHGDGETLYRLYDNLRQIVLTSGQAPSVTVSEKDADDFAFACSVVLRKFEEEFESWKSVGAGKKKSPEAEATGQ